MYRVLPANPNLDHLRKQAKALLTKLHQGNPEVRLADAQHAIARQYGFASWPKLKAYVESVRHSGGAEAATDAVQSQASEPRSRDEQVNANPLVGTWTANISKSKRHPLHQIRNATLQFNIVGDAVTIADVVVDESGREEQHTNTIYADGKEHEFGGAFVVVARWSHVLETVGKKNGEIIGRSVYEVSDDGNTLILSGKSGNETQFSQVIVFERDAKQADVG